MNFFDEKVMREKKNNMAGGLLMVEINISLLKDWWFWLFSRKNGCRFNIMDFNAWKENDKNYNKLHLTYNKNIKTNIYSLR